MTDLIQEFKNELLSFESLSNNTAESYTSDLEHFFEYIRAFENNADIASIKDDLIARYFESLRKMDFNKSTIQRRYSAIKRFFQFLLDRKIIDLNPVNYIYRSKKENKIPVFLNEKEIQGLIDYYQNKNNIPSAIMWRNVLIIEMLYSTGMRVSELISLTVNDIKSCIKNRDSDNDIVFVLINGKGNKERLVPLRNKVIDIFHKYLEYRTSFTRNHKNKYLFPSYIEGTSITRRMIGYIIKEAAIGSNIKWKKVSPHTIRHSFATYLLSKNMDLREIQELLGHSSINTVEIYTHVKNDQLLEIMEQAN